MKQIKNYIRDLIENFEHRTFILGAASFLITVGFAIYNISLALIYDSMWNFGISAYYFALITLRGLIFMFEKKLHKKSLRESIQRHHRSRFLLLTNILLFAIDLAMIAPTYMMVKKKYEIDYTQIPAIAIALYTFCKLIIAVLGVKKTKAVINSAVRLFKIINFKDSLVSILLLQHILIRTFGEMKDSMILLSAINGFFIWTILVTSSSLSLINAIKDYKRNNFCLHTDF